MCEYIDGGKEGLLVSTACPPTIGAKVFLDAVSKKAAINTLVQELPKFGNMARGRQPSELQRSYEERSTPRFILHSTFG